MAKQSFAEVQQRRQVRISVVSTIDHDVFERDATIRFLDITQQALLKLWQGETTGFGHQLKAYILSCCMKGHGKCELLGLFCKSVDSRNDAARGDADVTRSDTQAFFVVDDTQRAQDVVVVQQWFALSHADDVGYATPHKALYCDDLIDNLACG